MSDIALNANIYQVTKRYYDIVDDFLLNYRLGTLDDNLKLIQEVVLFFEMLNNKDTRDPHIQMLSVIVERSLRVKGKDLKSIATDVVDSLQKNKIGTDVVKHLEIIARILDAECLKTIGRTKGHRR